MNRSNFAHRSRPFLLSAPLFFLLYRLTPIAPLSTPPKKSVGAPPVRDRYLIHRHGETDANAAGILQGSSDFSRLTVRGRRQASDLASSPAWNSLAPRLDRIFVSPLTRSRDTLAIVLGGTAGPAGAEPMVVGSLREIDLYQWEGRSSAEIAAEDPEAFAAWKAGDAEGMVVRRVDGDGVAHRHYPLRELWERAELNWKVIRGSVPDVAVGDVREGTTTLISCHGSLGKALLGTAAGVYEPAKFFRKFVFPNCCVVEIEWERGQDVATRWRALYPENDIKGFGNFWHSV
mmetsp:Transcript_13362/g.29478  ORF Transcript_13362/g.29478 Transcript_13362/m.29478 type:complete len:289 (-) Transcript_13362:110-976(-)|eukprot:CAMPEP_0113298012 /NCGR_PEP_ID=MMETSP0010_2-20120614/634_1 /TAXON_ID=216773 ORGANISM="Corethron hystrix, Strain 308" /NCGR_SAMPLE_ID=MMETSP0010_2 /ASSEMBLY_ACC=CAM_ASM_000155 /LENGTH=288 /DNA_ID=CAMNT_0000150995 /DNA_START=126 /DNA_END=992 /DNA_ORIENTATION=+ /assembly_acc=CAM_ASM_000155